jgi:hypothetical protein
VLIGPRRRIPSVDKQQIELDLKYQGRRGIFPGVYLLP